MIDRFSKWQRPGSKPLNKPALDVKWRSKHAESLISKAQESVQAEAERDTLIFRWSVLIIVCLVIGGYVLFFMKSAK